MRPRTPAPPRSTPDQGRSPAAPPQRPASHRPASKLSLRRPCSPTAAQQSPAAHGSRGMPPHSALVPAKPPAACSPSRTWPAFRFAPTRTPSPARNRVIRHCSRVEISTTTTVRSRRRPRAKTPSPTAPPQPAPTKAPPPVAPTPPSRTRTTRRSPPRTC